MEKMQEARVRLTTSFARQYLEFTGLPGEREIVDSHVYEITKKMTSGSFLPELVTIATVQVGGTVYRANGQHTCTARLNVDADEKFSPWVKYVRYKARTMEEAATLYAQFDASWTVRKYHHLASMHYDVAGMKDMASSRILNLVACALAFEKVGMVPHKRNKIRNEERYTLPSQNRDVVQKISSIMSESKSNRHMLREPVICAMLITLRKNERDAKTFWVSVRCGDMVGEDDPRKKLRDYLMRTAYAYGMGATHAQKAPFQEIYSKCIHAWNAWRKGASTQLKYVRSADIPDAM